MAVIDTSISMTSEMLDEISAELALLTQTHEVTVVECDTEIHRVYPFEPIKNVHGRGNTSFLPPFEAEFLQEHRPDVILYFTDGEGEAPEQKPPVPVFWCLMEGGQKPAPWGKEIWMGKPTPEAEK